MLKREEAWIDRCIHVTKWKGNKPVFFNCGILGIKCKRNEECIRIGDGKGEKNVS